MQTMIILATSINLCLKFEIRPEINIAALVMFISLALIALIRADSNYAKLLEQRIRNIMSDILQIAEAVTKLIEDVFHILE